MSTNARTWQDNAAEFALLDKGEGWPFARLIACSVEKGRGTSTGSVRNDRYGRDGKTSAQQFARQAETSAPRVLRYLEAWERAAEQGLCTPSADLTPADAPTTMEPDIEWGQVYDASKSGGRPRDSKAEDAAAIIEQRGAAQVVDNLTPKQRRDVARELTRHEREDREAIETEQLHEELEDGVDRSEVNALEDRNESVRLTYGRVVTAYYALGGARDAWVQHRHHLTRDEIDLAARFLSDIEEHVGVLKMYLSDDVVGDLQAAPRLEES